MKKPVIHAEPPSYPTHKDHDASRRRFLKRLGVGALAVGFVGPLAACTNSANTSGDQVDPNFISARLPQSGFAFAPLSDQGGLNFAIAFTAYAPDATWDEGTVIAAATEALAIYTCADVANSTATDMEARVRAAVELVLDFELETFALTLDQCNPS